MLLGASLSPGDLPERRIGGANNYNWGIPQACIYFPRGLFVSCIHPCKVWLKSSSPGFLNYSVKSNLRTQVKMQIRILYLGDRTAKE